MLAEKTYSYQFKINLNSLISLNNQFKSLDENRLLLQKRSDQWQKEFTRLSEQSAKGVTVDSYRWQLLEKEKGELALQKSGQQLQRDRLEFTISLAVAKVYSFFPEIEDDYEAKQLSLEHYQKYLQSYKEAIAKGNGLPCFQKAPADKIIKEIKKHLTTSTD